MASIYVYNPKTKEWVLTWLTAQSIKPQSFTATSSKTQLVMFNNEKDSRGNFHRITFFDITKQGFKWKLEWSQDRKSWLEVYRITGIRK